MNKAMVRGISAVPVILMVVMALLVVSSAARPLGRDMQATAREAAVSSNGVIQFLRQMYMQQLRAGPSCGTNSSNGGCPRRP
ncbi:unnamed protein product [Urochloa decumbens]|uniref:Uncharacterized protein n=1 Tax=Urochloa decumbens TaxID=240449 RepID=A0ABC9DZM4_9POAL